MALASWVRSIISGKNKEVKEKNNLKNKAAFHIVSKQRDLAQRASDVWKSFEGSLEDLSRKVRSLSQGAPVKDKVLHDQQVLDIALSRLETSLKRTQDLQRELSEWERLAKSDKNKVDTNHPSLRRAIVKSELELRSAVESGVLDMGIAGDDSLEGNRVGLEKNEIGKTIGLVSTEEKDKPHRVVKVKTDTDVAIPHDPEGLVKTIRHVSRELAQETQKKHKNKGDIVDFLHQLKDLHAALRLTDRANGKIRDRLAITDGFRYVFTHH